MKSEEFNELSGRIEGIADFVLHLTAQLEVEGFIEGSKLTAGIRRRAETRSFPPASDASLDAYQRTLRGLAARLDQARDNRNSAQ